MLLLIINLHAYYALCCHKPRALAASLSEIPVSIPVYRYWVFPIPKYRYCQRWSVLEALAATATETAVFALFLPVQPSNRY